MEENNKNIQDDNVKKVEDTVKEIAKEGAKVAGKVASEGLKATGKLAGTAAKSGIRAFMPVILIVIAVIVIGGGIFAGFKFNLFRSELTIDKTANVIEEIKIIGEFTTACYYEEMALKDSYNDTTSILGIKKVNTNEIVLIGKGRVRAGFDLAKLKDGDINAHGDTLEVALPMAEIFDIILNPSDFTTEYESGTWSHETTKPMKEQARVMLEQNAKDYGIVDKAEESGLTRLETLFKTFGFNTVILTVNKPAEPVQQVVAEDTVAVEEPIIEQ